MSENLFETQYDLTKKSKLRSFYESKKILIYSFLLILTTIILVLSYYQHNKEKERILISDNYIQAKIFLEKGNKIEALNILRKLIFSNEPTYSTLSLFAILDENLINDHNEVVKLFNHLLENNKFDKEIKNLLLYKKILYESNYVSEAKLLSDAKLLLNEEDSVWNAHILLLLGDFYFSKKEFIKAKDFYTKILSINKLERGIFEQAKEKLIFISND